MRIIDAGHYGAALRLADPGSWSAPTMTTVANSGAAAARPGAVADRADSTQVRQYLARD